ncbi:sigma 54-interacting transcriptional regulator [Dehalobacter sp. DCM]|uniref:sigma-54 interaction domain-containing protein n=1 Tax=Dehalobacter sp. DCM TaxID=2907827 RepID=UPI003081BA8F|nr:sigma 54-interacting transcriptional regulator [Dehalobacter sp. DCM]
MIHSFYNKQDIISTSEVHTAITAINFQKELFLHSRKNHDTTSLLRPEVATSWKRSKKLKIDPEMQELAHALSEKELNALLYDKRTFVDLTKTHLYSFLPLLNIPKCAITIFDENGTLLDVSDPYQLLRLNPHSGSIWREETVGTTSTSLSMEYGKIVQLSGPLHYCKALENQLATTAPVYDLEGNRLGIITIIHHLSDELFNVETSQRILLWISALRYMVESQFALLKRSYTLNGGGFEGRNREYLLPIPEDHNMLDCYEKGLTANSPFSTILGESPQIQNVIRTAERFAPSESGILLTGESGTGKEMFAQAIHQASGRSGPFVAINCAALPGNLIASELFGYVGGAFTGAENKGRLGRIELAKEGTLFLDEIGDMPLEIQPNLLRVLEDKKVTRLGSNKDIHVDFRLIAATNVDLFQLVQEKKFRADLYYRLETLQMKLPPLRERGRDILLIANYFLEEICTKAGRAPLKLNKDTETFLLKHAWPGNIRQLKNAMVYAANMCQGQVITLLELPESVYRDMDMALPEKDLVNFPMSSLQEIELNSIKKALLLSGNNVRGAAKVLGLSKTSIYRKIKEYNIDIT